MSSSDHDFIATRRAPDGSIIEHHSRKTVLETETLTIIDEHHQVPAEQISELVVEITGTWNGSRQVGE